MDPEIINVGNYYSVRPPPGYRISPFMLFGVTNLFGLSFEVGNGYAVSSGAGPPVDNSIKKDVHLTYGVFFDRYNSLLTSVVINGKNDLLVRLNIYPGLINADNPKFFIFTGPGNQNYAFNIGAGIVYYTPPGISL